MFALRLSKDCYKVVVNLYCAKSNVHKGVLIGYGNKEYILHKFDNITRNLENTLSSRPCIEEYNCTNDYCQCDYISHYSMH